MFLVFIGENKLKFRVLDPNTLKANFPTTKDDHSLLQ
jgi:hypothetical protein